MQYSSTNAKLPLAPKDSATGSELALSATRAVSCLRISRQEWYSGCDGMKCVPPRRTRGTALRKERGIWLDEIFPRLGSCIDFDRLRRWRGRAGRAALAASRQGDGKASVRASSRCRPSRRGCKSCTACYEVHSRSRQGYPFHVESRAWRTACPPDRKRQRESQRAPLGPYFPSPSLL